MPVESAGSAGHPVENAGPGLWIQREFRVYFLGFKGLGFRVGREVET